jgi:hypothetical protein
MVDDVWFVTELSGDPARLEPRRYDTKSRLLELAT